MVWIGDASMRGAVNVELSRLNKGDVGLGSFLELFSEAEHSVIARR